MGRPGECRVGSWARLGLVILLKVETLILQNFEPIAMSNLNTGWMSREI